MDELPFLDDMIYTHLLNVWKKGAESSRCADPRVELFGAVTELCRSVYSVLDASQTKDTSV